MGTRDPMGLTRSRGAGTASAWRAAGVCLGSLHAVVLANGAARWRTRWLRASGPCINAVRRCFGALSGLPCHTGGLCGKGARLERLRHMRPGAHCKSLRGPTHPGSSVRPAAPSASPPLAHPARPPPQQAVRRQQPAPRRLVHAANRGLRPILLPHYRRNLQGCLAWASHCADLHARPGIEPGTCSFALRGHMEVEDRFGHLLALEPG